MINEIRNIFVDFLNMSITATYVIAAILILRLLISKMPKRYSYYLWSVVGFRLCCPVSFKSIFSLFSLKPFNMRIAQNTAEHSLEYIQNFNAPETQLTTGIPAVNNVVNETVSTMPDGVSTLDRVFEIASVIWIIGFILMIIYTVLSLVKVRLKLRTAIKIDEGIYESDMISSPFILGIVKPKIYLPCGIEKDNLEYALLHEKTHIKRFDYIVKLFAYVLLCVHWFNPLCWAAFYLMAKDMEMSCDEIVISKLSDEKKEYSSALLSFATGGKLPAPSPISFSEGGVKSRINNILRYKKPKFAISVFVIAICLATLVACSANPNTIDKTELSNTSQSSSIIGADYHIGNMIYFSSSISSLINPDLSGVTITKDRLITPSGTYIFEFDGKAVDKNEISVNGFDKYMEKKLLALTDSIDFSKYASDKINEIKYLSDETDTNKEYSYYNVYFIDDEPFLIVAVNHKESTDYFEFGFEVTKTFENTENEIDLLFKEIWSNDDENLLAHSDTGEYLKAKPEEYKKLLDYGDSTLVYIYKQFLYGNRNSFEESVMYAVMKEMHSAEKLSLKPSGVASEYFEQYNKYITSVYYKNGIDFVKKHYPKGYLLLVTENIYIPSQTLDIDDILSDKVNIGSATPEIIYADNHKVIINGTCGLIKYSIDEKKVTDRIKWDTIQPLGANLPYFVYSLDDDCIYLFDGSPDETNTDLCYKCTTDDFSLEKCEKTVDVNSAMYGVEYSCYTKDDRETLGITDTSKLYSNNYFNIGKGRYIYLMAEPDWNIKSLKLVEYNGKATKEYEIFKN